MEQKLWEIKKVQNKEQSVFTVEVFLSVVYEGKVYQKEVGKLFLQDLQENLKSKVSSPASKFYTVWILRQLISKPQVKVVSQLSGHPLFAEIQEFAYIDKRKVVAEKGKKLFVNDEKDKYGNSLVRLCLQTLIILGKTFPYKNGAQKQPTKFKKVLTNLVQQNIVLPSQYTYYTMPQRKKTQKMQVPVKQKKSLENILNYTSFKIEQYLCSLQDCDEIQQIQKQVRKKHDILTQELGKLNEVGDEVFDEQERTVQNFLNLKMFLEKENQIYMTYIPVDEFQMYKATVRQEYQKIFSQNNRKNSQTPQQQPENNMQNQNSLSNKRQSHQSNFSSKRKASENVRVNVHMMDNIFDKLQNKARTPSNGFKIVKESLEKEKKMIQVHPPRNKQNKGNPHSKMAASTFTKSIMNGGNIFSQPPNSNPPIKRFDGEIIKENRQMEGILYDIKKDQGMRRFKLGNLKNKYPLFENSSLQIGFKAETIFNEIQGFDEAILFELYFGNKTSRPLRDIQIFFQGDSSCLIYQNPQQFSKNIETQSQIKAEILIIPKCVPFGFVNMKFSYETSQSSIRASAALPTSIIRFTNQLQITKQQFDSFWQNLTNIYKCNEFKLTRHIPPNSIRKYMQNLSQNTSYSQFSLSGSVTDYELFCNLQIKNTFDCVLKISIRPNLQVVLQIGAIQPSEELYQYMKLYLQSLKIVLQECG